MTERQLRNQFDSLVTKFWGKNFYTLERTGYDQIQELGAEQILGFEPLVVRSTQFLCEWVYGIILPTGCILHSGQRPAVNGEYFLFGFSLTRDKWFQIMQLSNQEQVAHCLRWGTAGAA